MIPTYCITCRAISAQAGPVRACASCPPEGAVANISPEQARRFWRDVDSIGDDILRDDCPPELLDAELREMGVDPAALAKRGAAFVEGLMRERRGT